MQRIAVQMLAEGFLHSADRLEQEVADDNGFLHVPVAGVDADLQFFHGRVHSEHAPIPLEYLLIDAPVVAARELVQRFIALRFPESTILFLRSQATGRAVVECPAQAPLAQAAAAFVAVVLVSAAWDESEAITVEGGGAKHVFAIEVDGAQHWAQPVHPPARVC